MHNLEDKRFSVDRMVVTQMSNSWVLLMIDRWPLVAVKPSPGAYRVAEQTRRMRGREEMWRNVDPRQYRE